jgi:hypothetical protein
VTGQKYRATNQKKQAKKYNFSLAFLFLCPYNEGEKWSEMEQSVLKSHMRQLWWRAGAVVNV